MKTDIKKYAYKVIWSEEDSSFIGICIEFPSLSGLANTPEGALKEIQKVVKESIKWMEEENEPIPAPISTKSFKGNLTLRVPPEIHRKLAMEAAEAGVSINQYILSKVA